MSRRISEATPNGAQSDPGRTPAILENVQKNTVEWKEPESVGTQCLEVGDLEEEKNNIAQDDDDVAAESFINGFANKFQREAHGGQEISMDDLDIFDEIRDSSVNDYFQERDATHKRQPSNTNLVEFIEPGYSAVVCLSLKVIAKVVESTIVEPCGEIGKMFFEANISVINEPDN